MNTENDRPGHDNNDYRAILAEIRSLHSQNSLCGAPRNALLGVSGDLLSYVLSLLRGEVPPQCPDASMGQWHELLSALEPHRVLPLMYWQVMHLPQSSRPPDDIVDALRAWYRKNTIRSLLVEKQLGEIVHAMRAANIRFLVVKGPVLARTVYPDVAIRSQNDIDLLVQRDDVRRTRAVLENLGYLCLKNRFDMSKNYCHDEEFYPRDASKNFLEIEVHWDINPVSMIRYTHVADFLGRAMNVKIRDYALDTFSPVDHVLYSAIHMGLKHNNDIRLDWIYDISLLCKGLTPEDWKALQARSVENCIRVGLERSIAMARCWTGLQIPPEVSDFSKWPRPTKNELDALSLIERRRHVMIGKIKLILSGHAPVREKAGLLFRMAFPTPSRLRKQYGPVKGWSLPYYYALRFLNVFR